MISDKLARSVLNRAVELNKTLVTAESCTGGLLAAALTQNSGASSVFDRGFVTYSNTSKIEMLGVNPTTLKRYGAVSQQIAMEMASGAQQVSQVSFAASITGIAGPGGSGNKPEGRVCFGYQMRGNNPQSETVEFTAIGRSAVREASVEHALNMILRILG